ncbi:YARHG domain-containing protein [Kaistella sp.]|uniref:YARHG domain-containing protein n=1 Tax=Kaistella sp. TaxID=2782235 RepID=UPI0035A1A6DD
MKNLTLLSIALLAATVTSCKNEKKTVDVAKFEENQVVEIPDIHQELYGIYTGAFSGYYKVRTDDDEYEDYESKRLSLKINRITKDSVWGQSIVNGNQRPFRGVFNDKTNHFVLDEPGSDKTDGRFEVNLSADSLTGNWVAFDKSKVKAPTKTVKLIKKTFVYNPNFMLDPENTDLVDWTTSKEVKNSYKDEETGNTETYSNSLNRSGTEAIFQINGSKQSLTEKELKNLRKLDLEIIKNAIYARHGYSFKKQTFRTFFEQTDWYIPVSNDVEKELTPMEKSNIAMLTRFIAYAEDKYDSFGR